jgi:hypothetical protein
MVLPSDLLPFRRERQQLTSGCLAYRSVLALGTETTLPHPNDPHPNDVRSCLTPLQANSFKLRRKHHEIANYSHIIFTFLSQKRFKNSELKTNSSS